MRRKAYQLISELITDWFSFLASCSQFPRNRNQSPELNMAPVSLGSVIENKQSSERTRWRRVELVVWKRSELLLLSTSPTICNRIRFQHENRPLLSDCFYCAEKQTDNIEEMRFNMNIFTVSVRLTSYLKYNRYDSSAVGRMSNVCIVVGTTDEQRLNSSTVIWESNVPLWIINRTENWRWWERLTLHQDSLIKLSSVFWTLGHLMCSQ